MVPFLEKGILFHIGGCEVHLIDNHHYSLQLYTIFGNFPDAFKYLPWPRERSCCLSGTACWFPQQSLICQLIGHVMIHLTRRMSGDLQ